MFKKSVILKLNSENLPCPSPCPVLPVWRLAYQRLLSVVLFSFSRSFLGKNSM